MLLHRSGFVACHMRVLLLRGMRENDDVSWIPFPINTRRENPERQTEIGGYGGVRFRRQTRLR